jgi:hypothetical protein
VTQAEFLRAISAQYHKEPKKLQSAQLTRFRSQKGPYTGNTSAIFYGAYTYFEKLRIAEKKPKSKRREEMEAIHKHRGGLDTKRRQDRVFCHADERPSLDAYGRLIISGRNGTRTYD